MEDESGLEAPRRRLGDVPVATGKRERIGKLLAQRGAELPTRAGYQDAAAASRSDRIGDCVLQR